MKASQFRFGYARILHKTASWPEENKLTASANTRILLYTETVSERSFETQAVPVQCMEDSDDC